MSDQEIRFGAFVFTSRSDGQSEGEVKRQSQEVLPEVRARPRAA